MKYLIFIFILLQTKSNLVCQELKKFPDDVDISDFTECVCTFDSLKIKKKIIEEDFEGYRAKYDSSKLIFADLNADTECEILHYFTSSMRGWPFYYLSIYKVEKDLPIKIGNFPSYLLKFAESDGEYLQINNGGFDGPKTNPIYYNSVFRYNGKAYALYYAPHKTKEEFRRDGHFAYQKGDYETAYINFFNALQIPHHSITQQLLDVNNVAITLIKLEKSEQVEPLVNRYLKYCRAGCDKSDLAAAYFNLGLAKEKLNDTKTALLYFKKSCASKETTACIEKIKKYSK